MVFYFLGLNSATSKFFCRYCLCDKKEISNLKSKKQILFNNINMEANIYFYCTLSLGWSNRQPFAHWHFMVRFWSTDISNVSKDYLWFQCFLSVFIISTIYHFSCIALFQTNRTGIFLETMRATWKWWAKELIRKDASGNLSWKVMLIAAPPICCTWKKGSFPNLSTSWLIGQLHNAKRSHWCLKWKSIKYLLCNFFRV